MENSSKFLEELHIEKQLYEGIEGPYRSKACYFKGCNTWAEILLEYTKLGSELYEEAIKDLTPILGKERAEEVCKIFNI